MIRFRQLLAFGTLLFAATALLSGCGGPSDPVGFVSGKVILSSGENPEGLLVRFMNDPAGVGATSTVAADGSYALKHKGEAGVPVGAFKIAVTAYVKEMTDKEMSEFLSASGEEQKRIEAKRNEKMTLVPENYHNTRTSGLSYEVVEGKQRHDIDIVVPES